MNKQRRKQIEEAREQLTELSADIEALTALVETIQQDEQDYYDAIPESLIGGERAEASAEAITKLDDVLDALHDLDCDELESMLEEAAE